MQRDVQGKNILIVILDADLIYVSKVLITSWHISLRLHDTDYLF